MLSLTDSEAVDGKTDKTPDLFELMRPETSLTRMEVLTDYSASDGYVKSLIKKLENTVILTEKLVDNVIFLIRKVK